MKPVGLSDRGHAWLRVIQAKRKPSPSVRGPLLNAIVEELIENEIKSLGLDITANPEAIIEDLNAAPAADKGNGQ